MKKSLPNLKSKVFKDLIQLLIPVVDSVKGGKKMTVKVKNLEYLLCPANYEHKYVVFYLKKDDGFYYIHDRCNTDFISSYGVAYHLAYVIYDFYRNSIKRVEVKEAD